VNSDTPVPSATDAGAARARVLHVVDREALGCLGRMVRQVVLGLADDDIRVSVLTDAEPLVQELDGTGIRTSRVRSFDLLSRWRWTREETLDPPDVVHVWSTRRQRWIAPWAGAMNAATLVHCICSQDVERLCRGGFDERSETFLAGCEPYRQRLAERWPSLSDRFERLAPALLTPAESAAPPRPDGTLGVLWCDRGGDLAGLALLGDALAQLRRKQIDVHAILIGSAERGGAIWRTVRALGVDGCVSLVDDATIWDRAMEGAHVYVAPAADGALSLAPLLAMATGRVVIASRDHGPEWFVEDETCLMITPGSATELAYHLMNAAAAQPALAALTRSARDFVRRRHAVTDATKWLAERYDRIVARRREAAALHEAEA